MKISRRLLLLALGLPACRSASTTAPGNLRYAATMKSVAQAPTKVELVGTIMNKSSLPSTIHFGACSVGYRLYAYSALQSSGSAAYEFNPASQPCIMVAYEKTLAPGGEYVMSFGPVNLSEHVSPGRYQVRVTLYHDGVVGEAIAGQIDVR